MSLFISNFKYKGKVIAFLIACFLLYFGCNIFLAIYERGRTTHTTFMDSKFSKARFMELHALKNDKYEMILIGSSTTMYQVSTNLFKKNGINIYNFGSSDRSISDFGWMIKKSIALNPSYIVIFLPIKELFAKPRETTSPTMYDLYSYFVTRQKPEFIFREAVNYLKSLNRLHLYAPVIYLRMKLFYERFMNNLHKHETRKASYLINNKNKTEEESYLIDCLPFSRDDSKSAGAIIHCTNGDGILLGNNFNGNCDLSKRDFVHGSRMNNEVLSLLKYYVSIIRENHIIPIIVFNPLNSCQQNFYRDIKSIEKIIDAKVIDLSLLKTRAFFWAEQVHLNDKGRIFYSQVLLHRIKEEIKR